MKRLIAIVLALAAVAALAAFGPFGGGGSDYMVRAYFDNGDFVVNGEDVRSPAPRSARSSASPCRCPASRSTHDGRPDPGKAVVELEISDAGFQDFRQRRLLHDPPAVASRREVRRMLADQAAGARHARRRRR